MPDDNLNASRDDAGPVGRRTATGANRLPLVWFNDLHPSFDAADFVEGLFTRGGMSVVYGEPNCGKTFFMTDVALHVAARLTWQGRQVDGGGVIYCALEGSHGIANRVAAFRGHRGLEGADIPFAVVHSAINMLDPGADTGRLIAAIEEAAAKIGRPVRLVVIDTLSRALAGGNENAADAMGALVANTDRVRQATGAHVAYVHHTGKDAGRGARGHSLLGAAADTLIEVSRARRDGPSLAKVTKQREMETGGEFAFALEVVELGRNARGKPVTSCVVVAADEPAGVDDGKGPGKNGLVALDTLKRAVADCGQPVPCPPGDSPDIRAVTDDQWRQRFYQALPGEKADTKRTAFRRAKDELGSLRLVEFGGGCAWVVREPERVAGRTGRRKPRQVAPRPV